MATGHAMLINLHLPCTIEVPVRKLGHTLGCLHDGGLDDFDVLK